MAILNKQFKFIHTPVMPMGTDYSIIENVKHSCREDNNCMMWHLRSWGDYDYFYVEIFHGNAFHIYDINDIVEEEILEKIRTDNKTFLYIANTHEAFLDIAELLYDSLVIKAGIPARKIYIANESPDLYKEVIKYADKNNLEYMNVEWLLEFEFAISIQANQLKLTFDKMLTDKKYDKCYLNFNRRWRLHRPTLVALLKAKGLLDKGYVSLANSDDGRNWKDMWPWILENVKSDDELYELLIQHETEILKLPHLYLDTKHLIHNQPHITGISLYENSLVSLVTETTFHTTSGGIGDFNNSRFLSEKIFKPIAVGHPFIFMTIPKSLELLREIGYKTFHPYIDESYDNEFDDHKRIKLILKEIEKICNYTEDEVKEFCKNVKPICEFNQKLIMHKTNQFSDGSDPGNYKLHREFIRKTL